ncbi:glycine cleavage system aminomethyltransferase GcvT [Dendrosporobacter sp. 1207_IL3150]|uniref:glycine cleavage system aminomethyltransferase GcvT n=1 Tax=Dendrosporobacter sp. 1207_IL3150 TaxID=3084054 RepID=UPI002FDB4A52
MQGKQTPLYDAHLSYGGKIIDFGGWMLPVQYQGILDEHRAVRERAGLFDVSHMGEILVQGEDAEAFLQMLVTNDVTNITDNQALYTPMCYPDGGTVDDLLIYRYSAHKYLLVINAANIYKDWEWLQSQKTNFKVVLDNLSSEIAQLAIQGPLSCSILSNVTTEALKELRYYHFIANADVCGKTVLLSRTGYTGEDGFEIYCKPEDSNEIWEKLLKAGREYGLVPAGLGCRDTLRFEACLPLYGHELSALISPLEAGLGRFIKFKKSNFTGKDALLKQKEAGLNRKIIAFTVSGRGIARAGYPINAAGNNIGVVTSGSYSPTLDKNLGLGLINTVYSQVGKSIEIEIRGKNVSAEVVAKPFYSRPLNP